MSDQRALSGVKIWIIAVFIFFSSENLGKRRIDACGLFGGIPLLEIEILFFLLLASNRIFIDNGHRNLMWAKSMVPLTSGLKIIDGKID